MQGEREGHTLVVQASFRSRSGGHAPTDWTFGNYCVELGTSFIFHVISRD